MDGWGWNALDDEQALRQVSQFVTEHAQVNDLIQDRIDILKGDMVTDD